MVTEVASGAHLDSINLDEAHRVAEAGDASTHSEGELPGPEANVESATPC